MSNFSHQPVMLKEVANILAPKRGKVFVDGTCGLGGHSAEFLKLGARVIAIDKDAEALDIARKNLGNYHRVSFVHGNFKDIDKILAKSNIKEIDGVLLDLGVSSMQLDKGERGFSFQENYPLDMRMDKSQKLSARDVVNYYSKDNLVTIFRDFGEDQEAQSVAEEIVRERSKKPIETTKELVGVIKKVMPSYRLNKNKHFATNIFRSIRMEVNSEVSDLINFLEKAPDILKPAGKIVIISFHSIEDRIVKRGFKMLKSKGKIKILTQKPIKATSKELERNPRARSATLRAAEIT